MNLLLAIETSSDEYQIVFGRDRKLIFDSTRDFIHPPATDLAKLVSYGLNLIDSQPCEITGVALNIGPGGLTSIRAGVWFTNALAFSLGIRIYPFSYFEIMANQIQKNTELPVLCAVPAANNHAYVGLIRGRSVEVLRYGLLPYTVAQITDNIKEIGVAGKIRHRLSSLLNGIKVIDMGIDKLDSNVLLDLGYLAYDSKSASATRVSPLNDQSEIFYG